MRSPIGRVARITAKLNCGVELAVGFVSFSLPVTLLAIGLGSQGDRASWSAPLVGVESTLPDVLALRDFLSEGFERPVAVSFPAVCTTAGL